MLSWLFGNARHVPSPDAFQGVLKHNTVFVTDDNLAALTLRGFGARRLRRVTYPQREAENAAAAEAASTVEVEEAAVEEVEAAVDAEVKGSEEGVAEVEVKKVRLAKVSVNLDPEQDNSPMILFDEEAFYLFKMKLLELQHEDGTVVTLQELWNQFMEKNPNFPVKYKVYSHFRDQHFVVRTGIHYGLDYAVYRTLPSHCHSEYCAMVVDGTNPNDVSEGLQSAASKCQIAWRQISTLTRVMPDVMKLLVLCYVLPVSVELPEGLRDGETAGDALDRCDSSEDLSNEDILEDIFYNSKDPECNSPPEKIDYSTPDCLDLLKVEPVTTVIRRLPCKGDAYATIGDTQERYRSCSILKKARVEQVVKKKRRKRRDHQEVRLKAASKHNKMWVQLMNSTDETMDDPKQKAKAERKRKAAELEGLEDKDGQSRSQERKLKKASALEVKKSKVDQEMRKNKSLEAVKFTVSAADAQNPEDLIAMLNARLAASASNKPAAPAAAPAVDSNGDGKGKDKAKKTEESKSAPSPVKAKVKAKADDKSTDESTDKSPSKPPVKEKQSVPVPIPVPATSGRASKRKAAVVEEVIEEEKEEEEEEEEEKESEKEEEVEEVQPKAKSSRTTKAKAKAPVKAAPKQKIKNSLPGRASTSRTSRSKPVEKKESEDEEEVEEKVVEVEEEVEEVKPKAKSSRTTKAKVVAKAEPTRTSRAKATKVVPVKSAAKTVTKVKAPAVKKAPLKKLPVKKAPAVKKVPAKKVPAKKAAVRKAPAVKTAPAAKKAPAKKAPAEKAEPVVRRSTRAR